MNFGLLETLEKIILLKGDLEQQRDNNSQDDLGQVN